MPILLVEDDALLADGLARSLHQAGYQVDIAGDGISANRMLESGVFDLVLLDLGLPGLDGREVVKRLRSRKQTMPVLILSARMDIEERVLLLNLGADDYMVKPVAWVELEARIRALIRRAQAPQEQFVRLGRLKLDTEGKRAWLGEQALELSAREWAAVEFLASRINRVVNKDQITQAIYSWDEEITPNAVEKFISRLRVKLEPAGITIRTVRGLGYFLEKPTEGADAAN